MIKYVHLIAVAPTLPLGKTVSVPSTDAMEVAVIPDERDGLHDEIVGRENDLAAIEVKLDGNGVVVENNLGGAIEVCRKAITMLSHMVYQYALRKRT